MRAGVYVDVYSFYRYNNIIRWCHSLWQKLLLAHRLWHKEFRGVNSWKLNQFEPYKSCTPLKVRQKQSS